VAGLQAAPSVTRDAAVACPTGSQVAVQVHHYRHHGLVVERDDGGDDPRRAERQQTADQAEQLVGSGLRQYAGVTA